MKILSSCPNCLRQEILREFGQVEGVVLDVGCGAGAPTRMLSKNCKYIIGLDVQNVFDKKNTSSNLDFVRGDGTQLPFRDESFDAVVSFDVLEHVEEDLKFLTEIKKCLRKGGMLLLETPNRNRLSMKLKGVFNQLNIQWF
jgi:2-polyprenyl-3-methyl-5-hydroxy-6-metoxy-1,4-benzoquinol methylase